MIRVAVLIRVTPAGACRNFRIQIGEPPGDVEQDVAVGPADPTAQGGKVVRIGDVMLFPYTRIAPVERRNVPLGAKQPTVLLPIPADLPARYKGAAAEAQIDRACEEAVIVDIAVTCMSSNVEAAPIINWRRRCFCWHPPDSKTCRGECCGDEQREAVGLLQSARESQAAACGGGARPPSARCND